MDHLFFSCGYRLIAAECGSMLWKYVIWWILLHNGMMLFLSLGLQQWRKKSLQANDLCRLVFGGRQSITFGEQK